MRKRLLLLAAVVGAGLAAYLTGIHEHFEVDALRELVADAGVWGPLIFVLLFGLEGLGVPGFVFLLTSIALWPPWLAFLLNWLGALVAGVVGFAFARTVGREWISARLPQRMRRFEDRVVERGLQTVITVRLTLFIAVWAHWALGLSPVGWRPFLLGSAIGYLPWMLVISFGGAAAFEWLSLQPAELWISLAAFFAAGAIAWRQVQARRAAQEAPAD